MFKIATIKNLGIILVFFLILIFLITKNETEDYQKNLESTTITQNKKEQDGVSDCLKLLEKVNGSMGINESDWEAGEISMVNGNPVSVNNTQVKNLQEVIKKQKDIQANYGPFIMEKTYKRGGVFVKETDPGLIECAKDRIIISTWQYESGDD